MYVAIEDDRYHLQGVDHLKMSNAKVYTDEEYALYYGMLRTSYPDMFSINLFKQMNELLSTVDLAFDIQLEEVIDFACYYYCDWESVVAITDEFISAQCIQDLHSSLLKGLEDPVKASVALAEFVGILNSALQKFITDIISVLSRTSAPAIIDYGCCYRLDGIDDHGNVFFKLQTPDQVYEYLDSEACQNGSYK